MYPKRGKGNYYTEIQYMPNQIVNSAKLANRSWALGWKPQCSFCISLSVGYDL